MDEKTRTRFGRPEDPRQGLEKAVVVLRRTLEALEAAQVENAFVAGWLWARIAEALGVSKQAGPEKHAKRIRNRGPRESPRRKGRVSDLQPFRRGNRSRVEGAAEGHGCWGTTLLARGTSCSGYCAPRREVPPWRSPRRANAQRGAR